MCSLFHLALGNEDGGVQLGYESACCLAWRAIFDRRKDSGGVCVFSIFNAGGSVCVCECIYTHTHIHYTDGVLGCEPRSRDETPGGPEEIRWTKSRHTYIRICVQSTHVYIYVKRRDEIIECCFFFFNIFFLPKKKSKRCERKPQIISNLNS